MTAISPEMIKTNILFNSGRCDIINSHNSRFHMQILSKSDITVRIRWTNVQRSTSLWRRQSRAALTVVFCQLIGSADVQCQVMHHVTQLSLSLSLHTLYESGRTWWKLGPEGGVEGYNHETHTHTQLCSQSGVVKGNHIVFKIYWCVCGWPCHTHTRTHKVWQYSRDKVIMCDWILCVCVWHVLLIMFFH